MFILVETESAELEYYTVSSCSTTSKYVVIKTNHEEQTDVTEKVHKHVSFVKVVVYFKFLVK